MSDHAPFFSQSISWGRQQSPFESLLRRGFTSGHFTRNAGARRAMWGLIGINVAVFGTWQYAIQRGDNNLLLKLYQSTTLSVDNLRQGRYYTAITSAFSHKDWLHFGFNMYSFNIMAGLMCQIPGVGAVHIISLYLGAGIVGSLAWLWHEQTKKQTTQGRFFSNRTVSSALGASGAVMGTAMAATWLQPFATMVLMFPPIPIPFFVATGIYFAMDTYLLNSKTGIGHSAHLGGAVYGALFYLAYLRNYGGVWPMLRWAILRR